MAKSRFLNTMLSDDTPDEGGPVAQAPETQSAGLGTLQDVLSRKDPTIEWKTVMYPNESEQPPTDPGPSQTPPDMPPPPVDPGPEPDPGPVMPPPVMPTSETPLGPGTFALPGSQGAKPFMGNMPFSGPVNRSLRFGPGAPLVGGAAPEASFAGGSGADRGTGESPEEILKRLMGMGGGVPR